MNTQLYKINETYYRISQEEAEVINREQLAFEQTKSTTMLDFFLSEIALTRKPAWDEVNQELRDLSIANYFVKRSIGLSIQEINKELEGMR